MNAGKYANPSNYDVGHAAFPGHPGNANLGHPKKDCIHFLYSDIHVSPSGSDATGQGTAARPYRTIQKCVDAALRDPHAFYVYKRLDGGDPDPALLFQRVDVAYVAHAGRNPTRVAELAEKGFLSGSGVRPAKRAHGGSGRFVNIHTRVQFPYIVDTCASL